MSRGEALGYLLPALALALEQDGGCFQHSLLTTPRLLVTAQHTRLCLSLRLTPSAHRTWHLTTDSGELLWVTERRGEKVPELMALSDARHTAAQYSALRNPNT